MTYRADIDGLRAIAVFAVIAYLVGLDWPGAIAVGGALALSSTAFVLQLMADKKELMLPHGRAAFGVLLLQALTEMVNLFRPGSP